MDTKINYVLCSPRIELSELDMEKVDTGQVRLNGSVAMKHIPTDLTYVKWNPVINISAHEYQSAN